MEITENSQLTDRPAKQRTIFTRLLRGYRFSVCADAASVARALEVRRQVYRGACGYEVPVPDEYDSRSWLLLAEDVRTGEAVGSMRVTPRAAGPLECEEYLVLPPALRSARVVEIINDQVDNTSHASGKVNLRSCKRLTKAGRRR